VLRVETTLEVRRASWIGRRSDSKVVAGGFKGTDERDSERKVIWD